MKKTNFILAGFITLLILGLSSCFNSTYWEEWEGPLKGYVMLDENDNFQDFAFGNNPGQQRYNATIYVHPYDKTPSARIYKQRYSKTTLEYEDENSWYVRFRQGQFSEVITAFYCYCDGNDAYIINNRERLGHSEHTDKRSPADYRFVIEVSGMRNITIYMDDVD